MWNITKYGNCYLIFGAVLGFKGVTMEDVEAWKRGFSFPQYKRKESVFVDWIPIKSNNTRYIQTITKSRRRNFVPDHCENNFVDLPTIIIKYLHVIRNERQVI